MKPILLGLALAIAPAAADTLTQLHKSFMERYDAANLSRDDQLKKLDASYLAALNREVEKAKATGKLDNVIPFLDEVQAVKTTEPRSGNRNTETPGTEGATATPGPNAAAETPPALTQMRAKHAEAREKILKSHAETVTSLADKMTSALKAQESELTKAGKLDEALAAKHMRESLEKNEGIMSAKNSVNQKHEQTDQWVFLSEMNWTIQEKNPFWVGIADGSKGEGGYTDDISKLFEKDCRNIEKSFLATSPSKILVLGDKKFTSFKTGYWIHEKGDILLRIHSGSTLIREIQVGGTARRKGTLELQFKDTTELTIEVHPNGNPEHDWLLLDSPQVR